MFNRTANQKLWLCITRLRQGEELPPCFSLIGEPPDILIFLMALCQAFSRNFPYIRKQLTLEYEIEFCLLLTRPSKPSSKP